MNRRILVIRSAPFLPTTGSDISMFERLELLQRDHGWEAIGLSLCGGDRDTFLQGMGRLCGLNFRFEGNRALYAFRGVRSILTADPGLNCIDPACFDAVRTELQAAVDGVKPDLLITNFRDVAGVITAAENPQIPSVVFLTEDEYLRPERLGADSQYAASIRRLKNVAVAGEFIRDSLRTSWGIEARIFVNSINVERYRQTKADLGTYIGMLQPYGHKGVEVFLRIVTAMPERSFLTTAGVNLDFRRNEPVLRSVPNLHMVEYTMNQPAVYRECRLILIPSLWDEVFPRVMIEALASGTPVIASTKGGMQEAGGDAAVYLNVDRLKSGTRIEHSDIEPWIREIRRLDDPALYERQVELARRHTEDYAKRLKASTAKMSAWFEELAASGVSI